MQHIRRLTGINVPRIIVIARPNVMWETDFTKIYIDNEGLVNLTAYL